MFYRNLAPQHRLAHFGRHCVFAATLSLSLCSCANVTAQTLTYKTSWFGNSGGAEANHIMGNVDSFFASSDGKLYGATFWDEGGSNVLVFSQTDGSILCRPKESGTGSWGRNSQGFATGDGTYVYQAMSQDGGYDGSVSNGFGGVKYPASGGKWQVIRRYRLSDGLGASSTNGNGYDGSYLVVSNGSTAKPVVGLAVKNNEIYAVDSQTNTIKVYDATTMSATPVRSWSVTDPGEISVDSAGYIWMLQPTNKKLVRYSNIGTLQSQSITFAAAVVPRGFGIDTTQNRILVANDGIDQNILVYNNILTSPGANGIFGIRGGIFFSNGAQNGLVGPLLFNRPVGVGADSSGNIYVACSAGPDGGGVVLEKYDSLGNRLWNKIGLEFVDGADTAPSSETDLYTKDKHFVMDYSKTTAGTEATYKGYTLNPFKYPNDPRLHDIQQHQASPMIREMDGRRFLFISNMYGDPPSIYRFNSATDGEVAIPCSYFRWTGTTTDWMPTRPGSGDWYWSDLNGNGNFDSNEFTQPSTSFTFGKWSVDTRGDIWITSNDTVKTISKMPYGGLDSVGNPIYSYNTRVSTTAPSIFTELCRIEYEPATDTMWIAGYTTTNPLVRTDYWGQVGREIVRYDNWNAGNRTENLRITLPYDFTLNPPITIKAMALAGNYVFATESRAAKVHVYDRNTGVEVGIISPGPEVGSQSGWVDVDNGINVKLRANGEYLIFVEEDANAKVMMYRWTPASVSAAFKGPHNLPGTFQAEDYNTGGQGVAYNVSSVNGSGNSYRSDGVDLESCSEGGSNLGWTAAGQWFKYSVNVQSSGNYGLTMRFSGISMGTLHIEDENGTNLTGSVSLPSTGGWQTWQSQTVPVALASGNHTLKVAQDSGGFNINYISVSASVKLNGTVIGTTGSWNNLGNDRTKAFDSDSATFFDGPTSSNNWVGLDLGSGVTKCITKIKYCPRAGFTSRMNGGVFQGTNDLNGTWTNLLTLSSNPPEGYSESVSIGSTTTFRYVRYLSPTNSYGNVAEIEFYTTQ